jgi:hypothetical protein
MSNNLQELNSICMSGSINELISYCQKTDMSVLGLFLSTHLINGRHGKPPMKDDLVIINKCFYSQVNKLPLFKIKFYCNWTSSENLTRLWLKMCKKDNIWNTLQVVLNEEPDIYVVINSTNEQIKKERTILFHMEPYMTTDRWGWFADPPDFYKLLFYGCHRNCLNVAEWHLSKTYNQLMNEMVEKTYDKELSVILSNKYSDPGQIKRVNFTKYLDNNYDKLHYYGSLTDIKQNKGDLPYHQKDNGLFPYKYTFNVENNNIVNYASEKIYDAILAECLIFYWGCSNLEKYIDSKAFIRLDLEDFDNDLTVIKNAIENDEWSKRIDVIRQEKKKILNNYQIFPKIEKILLGKK